MSKWYYAGEIEIKHLPQCGWGLFEDGECIAVWPTLADLFASLDRNFSKEEE